MFTPERSKDDLATFLTSIGLTPEPTLCAGVYDKLSAIIGRWHQEQQSMETKTVSSTLLSVHGKLNEIVVALSGHHNGFRKQVHIEVVSEVKRSLMKDSEVGSLNEARQFLEKFIQDATKIAAHCASASKELSSGKGPRGRPPLDWHNEFTSLLLELAALAGVKPTINKDRTSGELKGWVLDVARELERFLPRDMRSPSVEALAKRIERSKRTLSGRQKGSAA